MASDSTMKQRLEELPNIGTVDVHRTGPDSFGAYDWTVTFVSNPGYFPVNSRNVADLSFDKTLLTTTGTASTATATATVTVAATATATGKSRSTLVVLSQYCCSLVVV